MLLLAVRSFWAEACKIVGTGKEHASDIVGVHRFICAHHHHKHIDFVLKELAIYSFVTESTFVVGTLLICRPSWCNRCRVILRQYMSKEALVALAAVAILLKELANRYLVYNVSVQERTLLVTVPAVSLHPIDTHLLLCFGLVHCGVNRTLDFLNFLDTFVGKPVIGCFISWLVIGHVLSSLVTVSWSFKVVVPLVWIVFSPLSLLWVALLVVPLVVIIVVAPIFSVFSLISIIVGHYKQL